MSEEFEKHVNNMPCNFCEDVETCDENMSDNCKQFQRWCEQLWEL